MLHDIQQINSLMNYIQCADKSVSYELLINHWISAEGIDIHDADTIDYYIDLIPMIKRLKEARTNEV